jgi:tetratricopeptide (TPR) repeat protein
LRLGVSAWIAQAQDQETRAFEQMEAAAELEISTPKHPVTPAPTLPAHELLGDLLLQQEQSDKALAAFKRSLELYPQRFNSLLGAARAARALGEGESARRYYAALLEMSAQDAGRPGLVEARAYLDEEHNDEE